MPAHPAAPGGGLVFVLDGPNPSLSGKRQPHIYGHETPADVERDRRALAAEATLDPRFHRSNRGYEIIDRVHEARDAARGLVIDPAAFTHTSAAILDAPNTFEPPVIEVHIPDVHEREAFRHRSCVSMRADGDIAGPGTLGHRLLGHRLAPWRLASLIDREAK